jgi:hypothetical protein
VLATVDGASTAVAVTQSCNDTSCLPAATMITMSNGNTAALYVFDSLTIVQSAALRFTGTLPIIVVAQSTANIQGQILVNGQANFGAGPGGFSGANPGPGIGGNGVSPAYANSASGGGSYCGLGGTGGAFPPPSAPGGATYGDPTLVPLIGGSAGGSNLSASGNTGGPGGGAIEIIAGQSITIGAFGAINAGGGGGGGYNFGGGGGAGGGILLNAPTVVVAGFVAANGGGGGEQEGLGASGVGADATANAQPAPGYAGFGGGGSAGASANGAAGLLPDAGTGFGAGGGGAGRIRINALSVSITGVVSPDFTTGCATQGTLAE